MRLGRAVWSRAVARGPSLIVQHKSYRAMIEIALGSNYGKDEK
jgi:hypothetical protein